jgi:serine/threonine protein kinase
MIQSNCPSEETFNRLLNSLLDDAQNETLNEHLESCSVCQSRLDALTDFDSHGSSSAPAEHDAAVSQLVSRLSVLSPSMLENTNSGGSSGVRFQGTPTEDAPLGELGHYKIQELVGSGASGLLYRAIDSKVDRVVAIKVLRSELAGHEESRKRFHREARAVAGLNHDGVVKLFEFVDTADFPPFLVMEYVQGLSISQLLNQRKVLTARESVAMAIPIAGALADAHEHGLVHRDIKPSNILIGEDSQPKVTDFGLALLDDGNANLTREGALAGTPAYISPEQILAPHEVDGRTDVYSLGVVLYQMLTGQLPFQGVARMMLLAVLHKDPPPLRQYDDQIPRDLETIVLKALSKDPDKRYETADAMADDLQRWVDGKPIHARPVGRLERFSRWCKRNPGIAKLSAAVAALLIVMTLGSVFAALNLSAAQDKTEAERDRALSFLESLISEVQSQSANDKDFAASQFARAMLDISRQGLNEIVDRKDDQGRLDLSIAIVNAKLCHALLLDNDLERLKVHFEETRQLIQELGGENSEQWPVVELCIEMKEMESHYFSLRQQPERSKDSLHDALSVAKKAHQRWPDNFDAHLAVARVQEAIFSNSATDQNTPDDATETLTTLKELRQADPRNENAIGLLIQTHLGIATWALENNDDSTALASYQTIIEHYDSLDEHSLVGRHLGLAVLSAHHNSGQVYERLGDKENALRHYEDFMNFQSNRYNYFQLSEMQDLQRYIDKSKKRLDDNLLE